VTIDVAKLPRRVLEAGTRLHRIHRAATGAWYFSGDGHGRFDPVAAVGRGACYFSEGPLGAWIESFRTTMTLLEDDVRQRVVTTVELKRSVAVIDLTDRRGLAAGATMALAADPDYGDSHDLASRAQGEAAGIRWRLRHDLRQELIGVALFGPQGPQAGDFGSASTEPIGRVLIRAAEDAFGYRVSPLP
jgi:hypothetical protein